MTPTLIGIYQIVMPYCFFCQQSFSSLHNVNVTRISLAYSLSPYFHMTLLPISLCLCLSLSLFLSISLSLSSSIFLSGKMIDYSEYIEAAHANGALVACATDLLALSLIKPPGEYGSVPTPFCLKCFIRVSTNPLLF